MRGPITLLTDFGTADGYVGEMKGVLATLAPGVPIVDIAHDIPPQDVQAARLTVERYWRRFPPGSIHLVVVDPGVGSDRAAIAVESDERFLVGPDNGVLSAALTAAAKCVALPVPPDAAPTFHGRDVFAPVVARLATGAVFSTLGEPTSATMLRTPVAERTTTGWHGAIIAIDRFGNAITNLPPDASRVSVSGRELRVVRTYSDLREGEAGALVGSSGLVEIAVRNGSAARELGLTRGATAEGRGVAQ